MQYKHVMMLKRKFHQWMESFVYEGEAGMSKSKISVNTGFIITDTAQLPQISLMVEETH